MPLQFTGRKNRIDAATRRFTGNSAFLKLSLGSIINVGRYLLLARSSAEFDTYGIDSLDMHSSAQGQQFAASPG
jgi:hypothetical protein